MPIRDVEAMNASLDNDYGTTRGPNSPTSHYLALFMGDPLTDGVEVPALNDELLPTGYARVEITPSMWEPAADGEKQLTDFVAFPATLNEWPAAVTHFALFSPTGVMWDCSILEEELVVTGPGDSPTVLVKIFHADTLDPEDDD